MIRYYIGQLFAILALIGLSSCSISSDSATEKKLVGIWVCHYSSEMEEDGVTMKLSLSAQLTLKKDNSFTQEVSIQVVEPVVMDLATVEYSGKWKASKYEYEEDADEKSLRIIPGKDVDASDRDELKKELETEILKGDCDPYQLLQIKDDSFTIYDEQELIKLRYDRIYYGEDDLDAEESDDSVSVVEVIEDEEVAEDDEEHKNNIPDWIPDNVLEVFGYGNGMSRGFPPSTDLTAGQTYSYDGYIKEYPISVSITVDEEGNVEGKYAFRSTLNKYGDGPSSWFKFMGVMLCDRENNPYILFEDKNPADGKVFEYALVKYSGSDSWAGKMINANYLSEPSEHTLFDIRFRR